MKRASLAARIYTALTWLLPPAVRARDAEEIVAAFRAMCSHTTGARARARVYALSFGRLPLVAAAEWWDHLRAARHARRRRRWGVGMDAISRAFWLALRGLRRSPSFTWSAVLLLGLGVGAVTTIFTVVDHLFLRPLPYPHAERLIRVQNGSHSFPSLRDFQAMPSMEAWAASRTEEVNLVGEGDPVRLRQARITDGFFSFFGARPSLGRLLSTEDFGTASVVVLSHGGWERLWGGDPEVVGRTVRVDGEPVLVAGVLSPDFVPPEVMLGDHAVDLWRPVDRSDPRIESRGWHTLAVAGRLAPDATLDDAARDAAGVAERRAREFPEHYVRRNGAIVDLPIVSLQEATVGSARDAFRLLLAAVTLLLLVACANVAHLFMARGLGRSREMAVRRALGAGTPVLAGQLLTESLLVAGGAAVVGTLLAAAGLRAFLLLTPDAVPRAASVVLDGRVLAFAVALASLTAIAFGLLPTLRVAGRERNDPLRAGGRGSTGGRGFSALRTGLIVTEVALSLVLVSSAGLLIRSFARLNDQPLGFRTEGVWTLPLRLTGEEDPEGWQRRMDGIAGAMERVPGVLSVTYAESVPLEHTGGERCCWSEAVRLERAEQGTEAMIHASGGGYIDVFQLRSVAGRPWTAAEARAHPAPALLNETLALELFGSTNGAVGREVLLAETPHGVVGVLADDRHYGPDQEHGPAAYVPIESVPFVLGDAHVAVRVESVASDLPRRLREAVWTVEPDLPVPLVRSMDHWAELATARTRFDSILFGGFGVVALLLAAGGLYGTLLYTVGMERRELGIRLALGASPRKVEARVLGRGLRAALAGAVLGGAAAWSSGRLLQNRLFDVQGGDLVTLAAAAGVLLGTAAVASWVPARRAATTDPLETLRQE